MPSGLIAYKHIRILRHLIHFFQKFSEMLIGLLPQLDFLRHEAPEQPSLSLRVHPAPASRPPSKARLPRRVVAAWAWAKFGHPRRGNLFASHDRPDDPRKGSFSVITPIVGRPSRRGPIVPLGCSVWEKSLAWIPSPENSPRLPSRILPLSLLLFLLYLLARFLPSCV